MTHSRVDQASIERATKIVQANLPPRYFVLDQLERYVIGTQYAHLAPWGREDLPLFERAPCIQYPIVARTIDSNADLCLGEGRWPFITSNPGEDDTAFDERLGLDEEESETLDRGIKAIVEQARLRAVCSELLCEAQGSKTAVATCCVRDGRLYVESVKAKHCKPTFDEAHPGEVESLEIKYPYIDEWFNPVTKRWEARVLLYRRVIDETNDTTYEPVIALENGADINDAVWKPKAVIAHGFGFCPVIWYRFMPKTCDAGNIDGVAIHEQVKDEIDGLNYALSMRHRAALYAGDPQVVEIGVEDGDVTAPMGRQAQRIWQPGDQSSMAEWGGRDARGQSGFSMQERKRGVGVIWRYANPQSKVEYLTLPPEALKTLEGDANALLTMLREALCYVSVDPADAKLGIGELSGKALEWFHKKQTDRCTKIREDFGHNCLLPLVNMLLRIVYAKGADKTAPLYLAGLDAMLPILAKFEQAMAPATANDNAKTKKDEPESRWFPPYLKLVWGPYFAATAADAKSDMDMTIAGLGAKLLTMKVAVSKIAPHFPAIDDLTQYLESLEEEARAAMGKMHDAQAALMNAGQPSEEPTEPDDPQDETAPAKAPPVTKSPKPKRVPPQRKPPATKAKPAFKKRVKRAA